MIARRVALFALMTLLTAPVFIAAVPPFIDAQKLAQMQAIDWRIVPNLGANLVIPLLAQIMPVEIASKIFMALALVLPLIGCVALHDAIFGRRSWWPLAAALVAYNAAYLAGLLNFTVAIGLAFLGAACWIRLRHKPWRQGIAVAAIAVPILFTHAFGFGFLFMMIGGFELHEAYATRRILVLLSRAARVALVALPGVMFYLHSQLALDSAVSPLFLGKSLWWAVTKFDPLRKAMGAGASFFTYDTGIDLLVVIAVAAAFAALVLAKKLDVSWLAAIAAALMLAYPFVPGVLAATGGIDTRLPVLAGFLLFAGITPRRLGRRETTVLAFAFAALIIVRIGVIETAWQEQSAGVAEVATSAPIGPVQTTVR